MTGPADTHLLLHAFADELGRCAVAGACTSPGSRSSPIVLALTGNEQIQTWSHLDERVAGFFALGLAKATGRPAVLTCTSGTAAAQYLPAVIEAHEAGVPLIVITADRPPELREVGAGQAIDQVKLYGDAVRWFFDVGTHEATPERGRWIRTLACRAVATAEGRFGDRPGPVHLNWALREPLIPPAEMPADPQPGRPEGAPWVDIQDHEDADSGAGFHLMTAFGDARNGLIVAGRLESFFAGSMAAGVAERAGWPLLAEPTSAARVGGAAIAHYDALLRDEVFAKAHTPDVVLRIGDLPTSKPLRQWLATLTDIRQVAIAPPSGWADPDGVVSHVRHVDPDFALGGILNAFFEGEPAHEEQEYHRWMGSARPPSDPAWLAGWKAADARASEAIESTLGDALTEPRVARDLVARLPDRSSLVVASSMPIRDVETFSAARPRPPRRPPDDEPWLDPVRILSNRGANGIDGTLATAFGVAAGHDGPVVVLLGDVAFAYDLSALLCAKRHGQALAIVVLNNDGGGIFEFLPLSTIDRATFEEHVATPPGLEIAKAADLYGCDHVAPTDLAAFHTALDAALAADRTTIIEVRTERAANVALHREVWAAVAAALKSA